MKKGILVLSILLIAMAFTLNWKTNQGEESYEKRIVRNSNQNINKKISPAALPDMENLIKKWQEDYPASKDSLVNVILQPQEPVENPHGLAAIRENKKGAMKVLALKTILSKEKNKEKQIRFLVEIIQRAEDPTMVKIAAAIKGSVEQGRSFFKDFTLAVSDLPVPE